MYTPSEINNVNKLAGVLRCEISQIDNLVNKVVPRPEFGELFEEVHFDGLPFHFGVSISEDFILEIKLPKRKVHLGYRTVYSVLPHFASSALKVLKFYLNDLYVPNDCVHGFIKKRNIVTNARMHLNKKLILNVDIKNFFESINIDMVRGVYEKLGFQKDIAEILSNITTLNSRLVAGFSTSPVIANLYCNEMDEELMHVCSQNNITYTRYADDITFSGDKIDILSDVGEILQRYGFEINKSKTRYYYRGNGQYVTGLSVEDAVKPRVPKYVKKRLRAEVYSICKYGLKSNVARILGIDEGGVDETMLKKRAAKIIGWLSFISSIEYKFAKDCFNHLLRIDNARDSYYIINALEHVSSKIKRF